jgi:hypothetical protein
MRCVSWVWVCYSTNPEKKGEGVALATCKFDTLDPDAFKQYGVSEHGDRFVQRCRDPSQRPCTDDRRRDCVAGVRVFVQRRERRLLRGL